MRIVNTGDLPTGFAEIRTLEIATLRSERSKAE